MYVLICSGATARRMFQHFSQNFGAKFLKAAGGPRLTTNLLLRKVSNHNIFKTRGPNVTGMLFYKLTGLDLKKLICEAVRGKERKRLVRMRA